MPNVELVLHIFIYYNMFKFLDGLDHYFLSDHETQTDTQTETHTDTQTYMSTL